MSDEIEIPADVLTWHDDLLNDLTEFLQNAGHIDDDEIVTSVQFTVEVHETVTVSDIETEVTYNE